MLSPTVAANAMSSTTTRPASLSAFGRTRGEPNARCGTETEAVTAGTLLRDVPRLNGERDRAVRGESPGGLVLGWAHARSAARSGLSAHDERAPDVRGEAPEPRRSQPSLSRGTSLHFGHFMTTSQPSCRYACR